MNSNSTTATLLETALNVFLRLDSDAAEQLDTLFGKVIQLKVRGLGVDLYIVPAASQVRVQCDYAGEADTIITGSPSGFLRQGISAMSGDTTRGDLDIQGDTEAGQRFQQILSRVEFDWEEALAKRLGDIPAHQMGNLLRGLTGWLRGASESTRLDVSEYLQEETRVTPGRLELEGFLNDADTLRSDVDRLEARLQRLETILSAGNPTKHDDDAP